MGYHHTLGPRAAALQLACIVGALLGVVFVAAATRALAYREDIAFSFAMVSGVCLLFYLVGLAIGAAATAGDRIEGDRS